MADQPPGTYNAPPPQPAGGPPPAQAWTPPPGPSGPRAGFWRRFAAALIDGLIFSVIGYILGRALGQDVITVDGGTLTYRLTGAPFLIGEALQIAYFVYFEGSAAGQTLGKRALGIRVIDFSTGGPIGYGRAFIRWIGKLVSAIPCGLGYFWMLWDKQKQTWHDKFANSVVVPTDAYPVP
jgi:uncharacterized RDD family membrane protein YckC